jgi:P-type Ca2+ transporter type 2C
MGQSHFWEAYMRAVNKAYLMVEDEVLRQAASSVAGLSAEQAALRLVDDGENRLTESARPSLFTRFIGQIKDPMVLVLLAAAAISALLTEWADSVIIAVVIVLNAALALYQEGRAARALEALSAMNQPLALVRRAGELSRIPASQLVVGDIVLVESGDAAPADMRLLHTHQLRVDESSLTGESRPVEKRPNAPDGAEDVPLAERQNMLFMGSPIVYGRGEGVVTAIGMDTQMGRIAGLLSTTPNPPTPLQKRLAELSKILSLAVLLICIPVFLLTLFNGYSGGGFGLAVWLNAFMLAVSLAVAAIPEGLVVVVTLVLSMGMHVMSREKAIIRRLAAVEGLGAVQVICSDKTGTLTENRMRVVTAEGDKQLLVAVAALCNSVEGSTGNYLGDPTELALVVYAAENGYSREQMLALQPLMAELPFDSGRKMMSTLHAKNGGGSRQYTKGAAEILLARCSHCLDGRGELRRLTPALRRELEVRLEYLAEQALRVLAAAFRDGGEIVEEGMVFVGFFGLSDPPRPEAAQAIAEAARAGITTVMVSGDNIRTACAIARELGLLKEGQLAVEGWQLDKMSDSELKRQLPNIRVFARVKPEDKLRIVRAWQSRGTITAMTGDGVNDAPALLAADIGVGMGISGAEVSKRVASLVLADDNFATIISAVREGRRIYDNIRKAVQFLLASNLAEVLAIFVASLLGVKLFLPIHLLWINLITDCFPAVALGLEAADEDAMHQPPRRADESIFAGGMGYSIFWQGAVIAVLTLLAYIDGLAQGPLVATTMAFITLSGAEVFHAWNMRSRRQSIFTLPTSNRFLTAAMLAAFALNLALMYLPALAGLFRLTPLNAEQLLHALLLSFAIVPVVEASKWLRARRFGVSRMAGGRSQA